MAGAPSSDGPLDGLDIQLPQGQQDQQFNLEDHLQAEITRVVNGQEVTKTLDEWLRTGSKVEAADQFLATAKQQAAETQAAAKLGQLVRQAHLNRDPDAMRTLLVELGVSAEDADQQLAAVAQLQQGHPQPTQQGQGGNQQLDGQQMKQAVAQGLLAAGLDARTIQAIVGFVSTMHSNGLDLSQVSNILSAGIKMEGSKELRRHVMGEMRNSGLLKPGYAPEAADALVDVAEKILYGNLARAGRSDPTHDDLQNAVREAAKMATSLGVRAAPTPTELSIGPGGADSAPLGVDFSKQTKRPSASSDSDYGEWITSQLVRKQVGG